MARYNLRKCICVTLFCIAGAALIVGMSFVIHNIKYVKTPMYDSCVWGPPVAWTGRNDQINASIAKYVFLDDTYFTSNLTCDGVECYGTKLHETLDILAFNGSRDCFLYETPNNMREIWRATSTNRVTKSDHIFLAVILGVLASGMCHMASLRYNNTLGFNRVSPTRPPAV